MLKIIRKYSDTGVFSFYILTAIILIMPVHNEYIPPLLILLVISFLSENIPEFKSVKLGNRSYITLLILFIIFFVWQTFSLVYTENLRQGAVNLFGRLSLVLFPVCLASPKERILRNLKNLMKMFVYATVSFLLFCFGFALYRSVTLLEGVWKFNPHPVEYDWLNYFYSSEFTVDIHPSYLSLFIVLSIFIALESFFLQGNNIKKRISWLFTAFFLIASVYFASSRAGILALIVLLPVYFLSKIINHGERKYSWVILIAAALISLFLIQKNEKVNGLMERVTVANIFKNKNTVDNRLLIWKSAFEIISDNPILGVGIGDVRDELVQEYEKIGASDLIAERYNAHNQFIEICLESGIIGILLFLWIFVQMILIAFRERNLLYGIFIIMMIIFFMFETTLYRLAGVTFFSLFSFFLLHNAFVPLKE